MTQKFKEALAETFLDRGRFEFAFAAHLYGSFFHTHGHDDGGFVMLQGVGWSELISNVTTIEVEYTDPEKPT